MATMIVGMPELFVIIAIAIVSAIVVIWPASRICRRAGYSPLLGVAAIVPLANLALLWFIAFSPWRASR